MGSKVHLLWVHTCTGKRNLNPNSGLCAKVIKKTSILASILKKHREIRCYIKLFLIRKPQITLKIIPEIVFYSCIKRSEGNICKGLSSHHRNCFIPPLFSPLLHISFSVSLVALGAIINDHPQSLVSMELHIFPYEEFHSVFYLPFLNLIAVTMFLKSESKLLLSYYNLTPLLPTCY